LEEQILCHKLRLVPRSSGGEGLADDVQSGSNCLEQQLIKLTHQNR